MTHSLSGRQFASDTWAGLCPEALQAIALGNAGHAPSFGDDPWTAAAVGRLRDLFETDCDVFFLTTGTAANSLSLAALCQPHHAVICHADAHIQTDECGAPEHMGHGLKLMLVANPNGKLDPEAIRRTAAKRRDVHSNKPRVVSITQATEVGTVYTPDEIRAVSRTAKELNLYLHADGARFANALAFLDVPAKAISWEAGVDVLCFGGIKNGVSIGDAVIFFSHALAEEFDYRRKQAGHFLSKMRFLTAPWAGLLESGLWLRNARHANAMAQLLERELRSAGHPILYPVQANAVFVRMSQHWIEAMHQRGWHFYTIADGERLMCSWDTQPEDIAAFVRDLRAVVDSDQARSFG
jgi:threonine aldolase